MANCIRCGGHINGLDVGGNQICDNCEAASGFGSGTSTDVPCQRCGMYLPSHELRMWNSRLYCAYCIMDVQDEEKMGREKHKPAEHGGEIFGGDANLPQGSKPSSGTCERCGRQTETLYSLSGRRVCSHCYSEGGAGTGGASIISQLITKAKEALGMEPKIQKNTSAQKQPQEKKAEAPHEEVFNIRNRSMVWKDEEKSESEDRGEHSSSENAHSEKAADVFNVRSRKMTEKKGAIESSEPISEGKNEDKKPAPKAKKFFFGMHPAEKGGKK